LNLILNAIAATPPNGRVSVEARSEKNGLTLAVEDEGPGLPAWAIPVLTDASTLPPLDRGGLGLWATSRLIADLGGMISVSRTQSGGGAV
ncbi:MAG: ATP-binding protein, partial [Afipia sp.]|nr:ATP-binding protein [Afipia sp.]